MIKLCAAAVLVAALLIVALFWRFTISPQAARAHRSRALRWRVKFRVPLGRGYASLAELGIRWGKLAAVVSGRRARPDLPWWARLISSPTHYAVRLGRSTFGKRIFARAEDQTLILAAPRTFKTAMLADRIIGHPGAALTTSTRTDLYDATAGDRQARGPVWVFNPQGVGDVPSSFGWNPLDGCGNPAMAMLRAEAFIGQLLDGDMAFWQRKAIVGLAALLHAGALAPGATMADVYAWAGRHGDQLAEDVLAGAGGPALPLLTSMRELRMTTKTADSVRATITEALSWVTIPSVIAAVTPAPGFDLDPVEFARGCGTIYLMAPGGSATAPLFRAFTSYVQYEATLAGTRWAHKKLVPPLLLALDELHANPVPLPAWLADSAGKGVQIAAVIHDVGQLEELYGVAGARTVWGTTGTKIFFGGIHSDETLEKVSKLCGRVRLGSGEDAKEAEVAPVDFLRTLPTMRALILRMNLSPVVVKVRPVWKRWDRRLWRHAPMPRPLPAMPAATAILPDPGPAEIPGPASSRPPVRYRKAAGE